MLSGHGASASADDLLFAGRLDWGAYIERSEMERRGREPTPAARRVRAVVPAPDTAPDAAVALRTGYSLFPVGERRRGRDTRCHCDRALPVIRWLGYDVPLERWCLKCGRVLPRPFDRKFLPFVGRDVRAADGRVEAVA